MQTSIVVVGSLNVDLVASVDRHPGLGETVTGLDFNTYCGGKGANQAVALGRLGASVKMIGKVGTDAFGAQLREGLGYAGVDISCIETAPGSSGTALIITAKNGENNIVVIPGANAAVLPEDIDRYRQQIASTSIVLGQLEIPLETTEYLGQTLRKLGIPFLLDPAPTCVLSSELLRTVTWLTPNETEAQRLLGMHPETLAPAEAPAIAERLLRELGVRNVIVKLGSKGVYMMGDDVEEAMIEGIAVRAVDTTAAGDAFNGAFAFALMQMGMPPREAAKFACAAAALSVTRAGAQASMPTFSECEAFLGNRV